MIEHNYILSTTENMRENIQLHYMFIIQQKIYKFDRKKRAHCMTENTCIQLQYLIENI